MAQPRSWLLAGPLSSRDSVSSSDKECGACLPISQGQWMWGCSSWPTRLSRSEGGRVRVCGECEHESSPTEALGARLSSERAQDRSERFRGRCVSGPHFLQVLNEGAVERISQDSFSFLR